MDVQVLISSSVLLRGGSPTRIGDQVKFRAADVFVWPEEEPLSALAPNAEVQGKLVGFSDSGAEQRVFAVVEVPRVQNVIVRVSDLEVIEIESQR